LEKAHRRIQALNKAVWRRASYVTVNSQKLRRQAHAFCTDLNYQVILNGIDTNRFRPLPIERQKAFLYVGRLDEDKNVEWLFEEIMPALLGRHPEFTFTVIGDGPIKKKLVRECQRADSIQNVKFVGWVDREVLPRFYNSHMFLLHPSISEGMSNVLLEAKACGLTCIGLDVPENRELLETGRDLITTQATFLRDVDLFIKKTPATGDPSDFLEGFSTSALVEHYETIITDCSALVSASSQER